MALSFPTNQMIILDNLLNWLLFDPSAPRIELEQGPFWSQKQVRRFGRSLEAGRRFRTRDYPQRSEGDDRPTNGPYDIIIRPLQITRNGRPIVKRTNWHKLMVSRMRRAGKQSRILHPDWYLCDARLELILNKRKQTSRKKAVTRVTDLQSQVYADGSRGIPMGKLLPPRPSFMFTPNDEEIMPRGSCPHEKIIYPNDTDKIRMEVDVPAGWKGEKCTQKTMRSWKRLRESKHSPSRVLRSLWQTEVSRRIGRPAGRYM